MALEAKEKVLRSILYPQNLTQSRESGSSSEQSGPIALKPLLYDSAQNFRVPLAPDGTKGRTALGARRFGSRRLGSRDNRDQSWQKPEKSQKMPKKAIFGRLYLSGYCTNRLVLWAQFLTF